jgi:hypothetical protein
VCNWRCAKASIMRAGHQRGVTMVLTVCATGCGSPGGVCVCPCGCVKGAGVGGMNDKKAIERVHFAGFDSAYASLR